MSIRSAFTPPFVAGLLVLVGAAAALQSVVGAAEIYLSKAEIHGERQVNAVAAETSRWARVGTDRELGAAEAEGLGTKNSLSRVYVQRDAPEGSRPHVVELHLAYYTGMVDTVPHVPERCMVGGGWSIATGNRIVPVPLERERWRVNADAPAEMGTLYAARDRDRTRLINLPRGVEDLRLNVTDFVQPGSERRLHAGYFFVANGGATARAESVRLLAFDLKSRYAYYLKVQFSSETVSDADELAALAGSMLDELLPEIMLCVPDWVSVTRGEYPPDNPRRPGAADAG